MSFLEKFVVEQSYLIESSKRRSGQRISPKVQFVVAHDTGNPTSTARGNVAYYQRTRDLKEASAHIFVDDKQIIECIPALTGMPEKAWHVIRNVNKDNQLFGFDANDAAVGIEYCYGDNINADEAYRKYIWVLAYTCYRFDLDPATRIVGHCFLDPARKTDPVTGLLQSRRTYDQLLRDVAAEFDECTGNPAETPAIQDETGTVKVTHKLNIRQSAPSTKAPVVQQVISGTKLDYVGWTVEGEPVNNNPKWYKNARGDFFWSGGVV